MTTRELAYYIPKFLLTYRFRSLPHKHEALRVGNDLRCIKRLLEIVNELLLVAPESFFLRARDYFAGPETLRLDG